MKKRRLIPINTKKQVLHTLFVCFVGVFFTACVAVLELYFLNAINTAMVQDTNSPAQLIRFLQSQREVLYYALVSLMVLTIGATFLFTIRFTARIFGPERALVRDLKKQTFLGQLNSELFVRKDDFLQSLVRQYRETCEDLDRVHKLYADAYEEIDQTLDEQKKEKKAA